MAHHRRIEEEVPVTLTVATTPEGETATGGLHTAVRRHDRTLLLEIMDDRIAIQMDTIAITLQVVHHTILGGRAAPTILNRRRLTIKGTTQVTARVVPVPEAVTAGMVAMAVAGVEEAMGVAIMKAQGMVGTAVADLLLLDLRSEAVAVAMEGIDDEALIRPVLGILSCVPLCFILHVFVAMFC